MPEEKKVMFSLTPLKDAIWKTHPESGLRFKVAPLDPETDQRFNRESVNDAGGFDLLAFYGRVVNHCLKDWEGFCDQGQPAPCNEANRNLLLKHNSTTFGPFICAAARGLDHFLQEQKEEAKNA